MSETVRVIKVYESFILGYCNCDCKQSIPIITKAGFLRRFKNTHHLRTLRGVKSHLWKGGRFPDGNYWKLSGFRNYPNADKRGRIHEHVYFYQEYHKCCMLKWGQVHHIDPVREGYCNNMPWNLEGMMKKKHISYHQKTRKRNRKDFSKRVCFVCKKKNDYIKKGINYWRNIDNNPICMKCYYKSDQKIEYNKKYREKNRDRINAYFRDYRKRSSTKNNGKSETEQAC